MFNRNSLIQYNGNHTAVLNAIQILHRDMMKVLQPTTTIGDPIVLHQQSIDTEQYFIKNQHIYAGDDLGFIYALLHISETALGVPPFWFWYDTDLPNYTQVDISDYRSTSPRIRYRGWFINDEILLTHWSPDKNPDSPWKMAFEALLRCGGNMVIPDTQINRNHSHLASKYGLWVSHHHAEPLGSEMFLKIYPDLKPNFFDYEDKFKDLWKDAILQQIGENVIWTLGFRGQGDHPFWDEPGTANLYTTDKQRGALISRMIRYQYDLVNQYVDKPVFCTYIYGEITDLYKRGYITIPKDVIKVWSDNGYGRMVSRRIGSTTNSINQRILSLPGPNDTDKNGIYYHASYCDLQSCSHLTQMTNDIYFVKTELLQAFKAGADDYLVVNCSNIRPHVFVLAMIAALWNGQDIDPKNFAITYFGTSKASAAYIDYAKAAVAFGSEPDEHAGDQFYTFQTRALISSLIKHETTCSSLNWATGAKPLAEQIKWYKGRCTEGVHNYRKFLANHTERFGKAFDTTIILAAQLHLTGYQGALNFILGTEEFTKKNYFNAFYYFGMAYDNFHNANILLRDSEYGPWQGFYANDCFADFKFTADLLDALMTYTRIYSEGPGFWDWERQLFYDKKDKGVVLQMNVNNRGSSQDVYHHMQAEGFDVKTPFKFIKYY